MDDLKFTTCGDFMKDQEQDKYAVVTVISQFRQRYVMPVSKLQEANTTISLKDHPEQIVPPDLATTRVPYTNLDLLKVFSFVQARASPPIESPYFEIKF